MFGASLNLLATILTDSLRLPFKSTPLLAVTTPIESILVTSS